MKNIEEKRVLISRFSRRGMWRGSKGNIRCCGDDGDEGWAMVWLVRLVRLVRLVGRQVGRWIGRYCRRYADGTCRIGQERMMRQEHAGK